MYNLDVQYFSRSKSGMCCIQDGTYCVTVVSVHISLHAICVGS